jgi:hypothetical protein
MKLSEAIFLGSMLKPQTRGSWHDDDGTCALAAALDALGQLPKSDRGYHWRVNRIWKWLKWPVKQAKCSACGGDKGTNMAELVMHMNDRHGYTREKIATWVKGIEDVLEQQLTIAPIKAKPVEALESKLAKKRQAKKAAEPVEIEAAALIER